MTLDRARESSIATGAANPPQDQVSIRSRAKALANKVKVLGYVEMSQNGKNVATRVPRDYEVDLVQNFEATETVRRPQSYVILPGFPEAIANLKMHGIDCITLAEPRKLTVESYRVDTIRRAEKLYEGHHMMDVDVTPQSITREFPVGTVIVRTSQPLGNLAVYLLEPRSDDGLLAWNFFDAGLKVGENTLVFRSAVPFFSSILPDSEKF